MSDTTETPDDPSAEHRDDQSAERTATTQRRHVRDRYADVATEDDTTEDDCCGSSSSCCSDDGLDGDELDEKAQQLGYSSEDAAVAGDANLGLGCGNPKALAELSEGERVLDLGSGAGFDCFLAAREVGDEGHVVGVDMTPEMVEKARRKARESDLSNVEFRLGEIEHLPVADESVDVILSNCVVNLSPEKPQVFREAYRVLRPGGRLAISDVVETAPLPPDVRDDPDSLAACVAGAATISDLESMLADAGFEDVRIEPKEDSEEFIREWAEGYDPSDYIVSATIEGVKPR